MKALLLICISVIPKLFFAQVNFSTISFDKALERSAAEGKIIFLQYESADCNQCNDVANKGFEDKEVAEQINQAFFCLRISDNHPDREKIASLYSLNASKGFGTLFIDNRGTLVHKFLKTTSYSKEYSKQMDIALLKAGESLKINELEAEYKKGNRSYGFLEMLLEKRKTLNLPTDSLLNEYIDAVPADSLKTSSVILFIAKMAPMLDSKGYATMRQNYPLFVKTWQTMDLATRIGINNSIISKSMSKAIKEKNEQSALHVASFAMSVHSDQKLGIRAYESNMMRYYSGIGDTATYYRKAIAFYDRYYMSNNVEAIKKQDTQYIQQMIKAAKKDTIVEGDHIRYVSNVTFTTTASKYSRDLNNAAYEFYLKTNDHYLLSVATQWSQRALEYQRSPQVLDTYARLLYKQGQADLAMSILTEAITMQQKEGYPTKDFDTTFDKMKNKKPLDP